MEFKADQALTVLQLKNFFAHPYLINSGLVSSIGIKNFPLFNYLLLPFGFISLDPQFLTAVIGVANVVAIIGFYFVVKKYYGRLTAFFAAVIFSVSPWAVLFSRSIWAQDLIPIFLVPFIYFLLKKSFLPLGIFTALLIQLHLSGIFLLIAMIIAIFVSKTEIDWKHYCLGLVLGFIPALPYILSSDQGIFSSLRQNTWDLNNFLRSFQILNGSFFDFELGKNYQNFLSAFPVVKIIEYLNYLILIPIIIYVKTIFSLKKRGEFLMPVIILSIPILYFVFKIPSYIHYYIISLPFMALITAFGLKILGKTGYLIFLVIFTSNLLFNYCFYSFASHQQNLAGDYGPIYSLTQKNILENTSDYINLPYYENLKLYVAAYPLEKIHIGLANAFIFNGDINRAKKEINLVAQNDPQTAKQLEKLLQNF